MENQGSNIPSPPQPDIAIRTMESDIKSLETSGGTIAAPEFFHLEQKNESRQGEAADIAGYEGSERPLFTPAARAELAETPGMSPAAVAGIVVGIVVLFGALGYFVIFPVLFPR